MPKKRTKQRVVRWRKVLEAMGACSYLAVAFRAAGQPQTLGEMLAFVQGPYGERAREHVVGLIQQNGLLDEVFPVRPLEYRDGSLPDQGLWRLWRLPFADEVVVRFKTILERESDRRGLTEWI